MPKLHPLSDQSIHDATTPIILEIEAQDIRGAIKLDPYHCAAARAIKRQLRGCSAYVRRTVTYINHGTDKHPDWRRYLTPEALTRELVAIDRGGRFAPGQYILTAPAKTKKLGHKQSASRSHPGKRRRPRPYHITANIRD